MKKPIANTIHIAPRALTLLAAGLIALFAALPTRAENGCPAGYEPWRIPVASQNDCVVIPDYGRSGEMGEPRPPAEPRRWNDAAAAAAWGDGPKGDDYVGVEHYLNEDMARDAALLKCRAKSLANCQVATSITNGVIAIGIDSNARLRTRTAGSNAEAKQGLLDKCARDGVKCKILKVYDGRARYF